jgi:hypothetical protein
MHVYICIACIYVYYIYIHIYVYYIYIYTYICIYNICGVEQEVAPGLKFEDVAKDLQPLLTHYYHYVGSSTYPPCYQGMEWMIATEVTRHDSHMLCTFSCRRKRDMVML